MELAINQSENFVFSLEFRFLFSFGAAVQIMMASSMVIITSHYLSTHTQKSQ